MSQSLLMLLVTLIPGSSLKGPPQEYFIQLTSQRYDIPLLNHQVPIFGLFKPGPP